MDEIKDMGEELVAVTAAKLSRRGVLCL